MSERDIVPKEFASRIIVEPSGCWRWTGNLHSKGYGRVFIGDTNTRAHRLIYERMVGPIPDGLQIDHLCRNRACVNPAHLEPVTSKENTMRGDAITARLAARTHCNAGHPFDGDNLTFRSDGTRRCRKCKIEGLRLYRLRRKRRAEGVEASSG